MDAKEAAEKGYAVIAASLFEVGLTYRGKGVRTWWAHAFGDLKGLPPLDHPIVMEAILTNEKYVVGLFTSDDVKKGIAGRDHGMEQAANHADRVEQDWQDQAYAIMVQYISRHRWLSTEDVRKYAHDVLGLAEPPDGRAWGAVARRAAVAGLIEHDHFEDAKNPKKHRCPLRIWRRKE